jgi:hypothetical protein
MAFNLSAIVSIIAGSDEKGEIINADRKYRSIYYHAFLARLIVPKHNFNDFLTSAMVARKALIKLFA